MKNANNNPRKKGSQAQRSELTQGSGYGISLMITSIYEEERGDAEN